MNSQRKILFADDDGVFRQAFAEWLKDKFGFTVVQAENPDLAYQKFMEAPQTFRLAVLDYSMPGGFEYQNGIELLQGLHQTTPDLPVILLTGHEDPDSSLARRALQAGAHWYLRKPPDLIETEVLIRSLGRLEETAEKLTAAELRAMLEEKYHLSYVAISYAIAEAKDIKSLLETVSRHAPAFLDAAECSIMQVDEKGRITHATPEWSGRPVTFDRHYVRRKITNELSRDGGIHIVADISKEEDLHPDMIQSGFKAFAGAACPQEAGAGAALYAYFDHALDSDQELRLTANLATLARLVGVAMENVREIELDQTLLEAGKRMLEAHGLQEVVDIVHDTIAKAFRVSTYFLATYDQPSGMISFPLGIDKGSNWKIEPRHNTVEDGGLTGHILRSGQPYESPDLTHDDQLPVQPIHIGQPAQAFYGCPLVLANGRVVGAIAIQRYSPRRFSDAPKRALQTLAALAAQTLYRLDVEQRPEDLLRQVATQSLDVTLYNVAHEVKEQIQADIVTLHVYDARHRKFQRERIRLGLPEEEAAQPYTGGENRALERLLDKGEWFTSESNKDSVFKSDFIRKHKIVASGGLALRVDKGQPVVGVLVVNFKHEYQFSNHDKEILRRYGQRAALAIHNTLLNERYRDSERKYRAEQRVMEAIQRHASNRSAIVNGVVDAVATAWPPQGVTVSLMYADAPNRRLIFAEEVRDLYRIDVQGQLDRHTIAYGEGICGWVAATGQPVNVPDVRKDPRYLKLRRKTLAEVCVPLKLGNKFLGVLDVEAETENYFSSADLTFLQRVADELAVAWGAAGKGELAQKVLDAAARTAQVAASQPKKALSELAYQAHQLIGETRGKPTLTTVYLRTAKGLELAAAWPQERYAAVLEQVGPFLPLDEMAVLRSGIVGRAARLRRSLLIPNVGSDKDYIQVDATTNAQLAVPILSGDGSALGVLAVEYANAEALGEDDRQLLETLASQAAVTTVAQLQARQLDDTRQAQIEATTLALMGIVAVDHGHGWKNAAATITENINLIRSHISARLSGRRGMVIRALGRYGWGLNYKKIDEWSGRMERKVQALTEMSRHTEGLEATETISVNGLLSAVLERWQSLEPEVIFSSEIQLDDRECVQANRIWLIRGLENLISNAVRACRDKPACRITLRSVKEGRLIRLEVEDNGPGIQEPVRNFLFHDVVPKHLRSNGWGAGCLITQFIARAYGGRAGILRTNDNGSVVALELPALDQSKNSI
ncbi:MAG: GAF domain-containing protein [Chloroflexi bacterium]|nr:GAF domain-containing protein [Chloroflexota bacterium]